MKHLLHTNKGDKSVLSLLLTRSHAQCGCLEALLLRLHLNASEINNKVILTVPEMLDRIKTTVIDRVAGAFNLWISANLLNLENSDHGKFVKVHR